MQHVICNTMKVNDATLVNAWNSKIREEIGKLYSIRSDMAFLLKHEASMDLFLEPEMQKVIEKLQSLMQ